MYHIIGVDGREYGPVDAEQVKQWFLEHRANSFTRARREGETEWKPLSDFPEFAEHLRTPPPVSQVLPPVTPQFGDSAQADRIADQILSRDYDLQIGYCISRGWDLVMSRFWMSVGVSLVIFLIIVALGSVPVVGGLASLALTYVLAGGLDWFFLKMVRGQTVDVADAFIGFSGPFVPLLLFSIVGQLLLSVGFLLCILPGIYLLVAWMMVSPLIIIDKKLDFWPAMELSRKVVSRHWWHFFGLLLLCFLINLVGLLALCVGLLVTIPVTTAAIVYAYEDVFNPPAPAAGLLAAVPGASEPPAPSSDPGPGANI